MSDTRISPEQAINFLENMESLRNENWLSKQALANKIYPESLDKYGYSLSALTNKIKNIEAGKIPKAEFINRVAIALGCPPEELLSPLASSAKIRRTGLDFIKAATNKGLNIQDVSSLSGISVNKLSYVVNSGIGKFNEKEILRLLRLDLCFTLPTLAPFIAEEVDIVSLANSHEPPRLLKVGEKELEWLYQRRAISAIAREKNISAILLSQVTGLKKDFIQQEIFWNKFGAHRSPDNFKIPPKNQWKKIVSALGMDKTSKNHLILMGKYSLTSSQLNELIYCETLLKKYVETISNKYSGPIVLNQKDLYHFFVGFKQEYCNMDSFKDLITKVAGKIGWKKFVAISAITLTAVLKSAPLAAAEITADYGVEFYDQHAKHSQESLSKYMYVLMSHNVKFLFLLPKAVRSALKFSKHGRSNLFTALLTLPADTITRFIEADGWSEAIVNDWIEIGKCIRDEFMHEFMCEKVKSDNDSDDLISHDYEYEIRSIDIGLQKSFEELEKIEKEQFESKSLNKPSNLFDLNHLTLFNSNSSFSSKKYFSLKEPERFAELDRKVSDMQQQVASTQNMISSFNGSIDRTENYVAKNSCFLSKSTSSFGLFPEKSTPENGFGTLTFEFKDGSSDAGKIRLNYTK